MGLRPGIKGKSTLDECVEEFGRRSAETKKMRGELGALVCC